MIRFYNTLTKKVDVFKPLIKKEVSLYSCGPTVYDFPHIGNLRRYITDDILHRLLRAKGYKVKRIINITDVGHLTQDDYDSGEDKMVLAAKREGKSPLEIADFYTNIFYEDSAALNFVPPDQYTKATDHIKEMQDLVADLLEKDVAYEVNGNVYYNVDKYKQYGQLSGNTLESLREKVRPELNAEAFKQKKSPADFALWIKAQPKHLLQWPSPWSKGYPGWHIECAAMILKHLGPTIDIHTGGQDNIFPHHEDEMAEAEASTGKQLARYWLHTRYLLVDGKKMSKSKGTLIRLADLVEKKFNPLAFRYLILSAHFSSLLNFTWKSMQAAQDGWEKINNFYDSLRNHQVSDEKPNKADSSLVKRVKTISKEFYQALEDNLGTPQALVALSKLVTLGNSVLAERKLSLKEKDLLQDTLTDFDHILALIPKEIISIKPLSKEALSKLTKLLDQRLKFKKSKNYGKADKIREDINNLGFELEDTAEGWHWRQIKSGKTGFYKFK